MDRVISSALTGMLVALAGCAPAVSSLQARSAKQLGCGPAHQLKVSAHNPGDPRQNQPERWEVAGCGRAYRCSSFLMTTGEPAHTECVEANRAAPRQMTADQRGQVSARLKRAAIQRVAAESGCAAGSVKVKGEVVQGSAFIHMVDACGQSYRCLTLGAGSEREDISCDELAQDL